MKNDVEGSFIPVKNYDFTLPADFKVEEPQAFTATLQPKKGPKIENKTKSENSQTKNPPSEKESDLYPDEEEKPKTVILKQASNPKTAPRRPSSAKNPFADNRGKTQIELKDEESQKQGAKEFVSNWLEQADKRREAEVEKVEKTTQIKRYDNKLSEEISELIKKIETTRKHTTSSLKNMKKTLTSHTSVLPSEKPSLSFNPFKSFTTPYSKPSLKSTNPSSALDLHALYSTEFSTSKKPFQEIVSDDEDFVKNIEFDD